MKYLLFIFFISITVSLYSQNINVLDESTKKPIPYAVVFLDSIGKYTDEKGTLSIDNLKYSSIKIQHLAYQDKEILKRDFNDTIYLKPKTLLLNDVTVFNKKRKKLKTLKFKPYYGLTLFEGSESISCIYPKNKDIMFAKSLKYNIYVVKPSKYKIQDSVKHIFKLNIYENVNFKPKSLMRLPIINTIFESELKGKNRQLIYDFEDNPLIINDKGICFGLEHITYRHEIDFTKNIHINASFSQKSKYFSFKAYLRYPLAYKDTLKTYDKVIKDVKNPVLIPDVVVYK